MLHEVTHELRLCEEDVVEFVYAELVHLIDMLSAVQILVEGLDLTCIAEKYKTPMFHEMILLLLDNLSLVSASTLIMGFWGVTELCWDVFIVIKVQWGGGNRTTKSAGFGLLLYY